MYELHRFGLVQDFDSKVAGPNFVTGPRGTESVTGGITRRGEQKPVGHHAEATIREKIRMFDGLKSRGGEGAIRNRAGWLYSAIVLDYAAPAEPQTPKQGTGPADHVLDV